MPLSYYAMAEDSLAVSWTFDAHPQDVWNAFSQPAVLSQWLGTASECDLAPGGELVIDHGDGMVSRSLVIMAQEPYLLVMTWDFPDEPESQLDISLHPTEQGCLLELRHLKLGDLASSYLPGWITHLTFLEAAVSGTPLPSAQFWPLHATLHTLCP
ncbi:SRPBCC domain-containing protein [Arthrobacter sp. 7Tela_A1]|uniref:SRPBCC domain-containing protein n=1 Tax=Arthrobacter sp. 7Tela_A1 TaxID=3093745 RepID=UPI003BB4F38A